MSSDLVKSFSAATTLSAQRIVEVTGDHTVAYATSSSLLPIGVTIDSMADTTNAIAVQLNGLAKLYFNDTVSAGGLVSADDSGRAVPYTAATVAAGYVGVLVGAAVAATGTIANVLILPGSGSTG